MQTQLQQRILDEINSWTLVDPHTHINPLSPASQSLADILGYHYYTELAHSAGLPSDQIEDPEISDREKVARLMEYMPRISNTAQWSWFEEIASEIIGKPIDLDANNWEVVYDAAEKQMAAPNWEEQVLTKSKLSKVFLTNDFDDPLVGFNTDRYVPCLRTDDLVFHFARMSVRSRLEEFTDLQITSLSDLKTAIGKLFMHFVSYNARACAISLPPFFAPNPISDSIAEEAFSKVVKLADSDLHDYDQQVLAQWVFWTLAEHCRDHQLPFDLMIGVNRSVYAHGVYQGMDLYDSRVSLIQYADLFNAFPSVKFPISVLASVTNQELVDYAWIFPNVITHGHWWYSNTPSIIRNDLAARLEAIPRTKILGYYSDMYKLEFALPKFNMYKRILTRLLAEDFVIDRQWSETKAIDLARAVLIDNIVETFGLG